MTGDGGEPGSGSRLPGRRSVFWRVAAVLVGVQMLAVVLAISLSAWFAYDRALDLATTSVRLRLDAVAEEIERAAAWGPAGLDSIPAVLRADLSRRFPDPVYILGSDGTVVAQVNPAERPLESDETRPIPAEVMPVLSEAEITISRDGSGGWAFAPLFGQAGFPEGGVLVFPLSGTLARELGPAAAALTRAVGVVLLLVLAIALVLATLVTWQFVRPVRAMVSQIEAIGRGDFTVRLLSHGTAEFDRLARSIHAMADEVAESFERLRSTDRLRRELIANVGHDLRTPLAALAGRVEEASRHIREGDTVSAARQLAGADAQARYLARLVDDLFELSVLDAPEPVLRVEPVPIAEWLSDALAHHEAPCREAGIRLEADLAPDLPVIRADGVRLMRLMDNLLINARQHTPEGGTITVSASREGARILVRVTDSGEGIPPESVTRLFDRYNRGSDARTRSRTGTGLGLAIARAVAPPHGGSLEAANRAEGGAEFVLTLPTDLA